MGITLNSKRERRPCCVLAAQANIAGISDVLANAVSQTRGTSLTISEVSRVPAAHFAMHFHPAQ